MVFIPDPDFAGDAGTFRAEFQSRQNVSSYPVLSFDFEVDLVEDAPSDIRLSNHSVRENVEGDAVGILTAIDGDIADFHSFQIVGDMSGLFEITNGTLRLKQGVTVDFEEHQSFTLRIRAIDSTNRAVERNLTIDVQNESVETIVGNDMDDELVGTRSADSVQGLWGDDVILGLAGADTLEGGGGADSIFGAQRDVIMDFDIGADIIHLGRLHEDRFVFQGTGGFAQSGLPSVKIKETASGDSLIQIDIDGDRATDTEILVRGVTGLSETDFILLQSGITLARAWGAQRGHRG
ncbi:MAG: hypothetical protein MK160_15850 [Rhodobacteraceae bacterium]|nr:hypothetical protein [Paracoccaceae bacterium]